MSIYYQLLLCLALLATAITHTEKNGLIIIPGLGRNDRLQVVLHNLNQLRSYIGKSWDCVIYIYAPRDDIFWQNNIVDISKLYEICEVVEHPNKRFTENLFLVQPALLKSCYEYIFILLDDIKIADQSTFSLDKMIAIMKHNSLTVASPAVMMFTIDT